MTLGWKKVGVLAAIATALLLFAAMRPGIDTRDAEANLAAPGGINVLPTGVPAIPAITNQEFPGVIGTGETAIATAFCVGDSLSPGALPIFGGNCPESDVVFPTLNGRITFTLERLYPPTGGPAAEFAASGDDTVTVTDNTLGGGDLDIALGVVSVLINAAAATTGGTQGVNEILEVKATDEEGDVRTTQLVVIDTILAWTPEGVTSTASQEQPAFISYHCPVSGRAGLAASTPAAFMEAVIEGDGFQGLDDMYDGLYGPNLFLGGPGAGLGTNTIVGDVDIADKWCGGNTGGLFDDGVSFQTNINMFDVGPVAGAAQIGASQAAATIPPMFYPPGVDMDCASGQNITTRDADALTGWWAYWNYPLADHEVGCDLDGWRNTVVTTELLATGQGGVANITAQQGGGIADVRQVDLTFIGGASTALFLGIDAPPTIGPTGDYFEVTLVDANGVPVSNESIECLVSPASSGLAVVPATGSTCPITGCDLDNDGETGEDVIDGVDNDGDGAVDEDPGGAAGSVRMQVVPTGIAVIVGDEITLTCTLDSNPDVSASQTIGLSMTPTTELVDLVGGCQIVTPTAALTAAALRASFDPEYDSAWLLDAASGTWMGDSPAAGAAMQGPNDLPGVDRLEGFFACMPEGGGTFERAVL